ncbi:fimbrillin family protein [Bacteroides helcogenes]|uniref:fimbrillin family protein n=1 Tax=Bacteroides helcogenes TaxID=290053 RepID=UPI0002DAC17D|nr:fimbrillin family protein [Bacteroides helcogenes]MDY5237134.1 fimbrillin family protein [Bacteroides helcogenes]
MLRTDKDKIQLGSTGGDLLLGSDHTPKIRLFSGIPDIDGECLILSPYGKACFPGSLVVRHNYGVDLLSSYKVNTSDEGIIIHKRLRMGTADGTLLMGDRKHISVPYFNHILSQIAIEAKCSNDKVRIEILGVKLVNITTKADFTFPTTVRYFGYSYRTG